MATEQDLYNVLTGQKIRDDAGYWHVYSSTGTELTAPEGVVLRAIPGAILSMGNTRQATHSGETRLWMYQLYSESIEKDKEKRESENAPKSIPKLVIKPKTKPRKPATVLLTPKKVSKPLPIFAPVFTQPAETTILDTIVGSILNNPLPTLRLKVRSNPVKTITAITKSSVVEDTEDEEIEFLLMAA